MDNDKKKSSKGFSQEIPNDEQEAENTRENTRKIILDNINDSGSIETHNKYGIHTLIIAGQIEGHYTLSGQAKSTKYEQVLPQLVGVEENDDIDGLLVILNEDKLGKGLRIIFKGVPNLIKNLGKLKQI